MSMQHHGDSEHIRRFFEQATGTAKREYPHGRMGGDDDGALAYAIATDQAHRTIVIKFPKPVDWIGLDIKTAEELRDQLTERLMALRGITA